MGNELIALEDIKPGPIFAGDGLDPLLARIEEEARALSTTDVTTAKGREAIASVAYKVARSKTYLDNLGKDYVADLKAQASQVDERRRYLRTKLDGLRDEIRHPLNEWEAERDKADQQIADIRAMATSPIPRSSQDLEALLQELDTVKPDEIVEDRRETLLLAIDETRQALQAQLEERRKVEAWEAEQARKQQEEEERRRKEEQERIAREAAEKARREAEEKAKREAEERERRHREELERERRAREEEQRRLEIKRQEEEAQRRRQEEEARQRAADEEHRRKVNNAAVEALVKHAAISFDDAKAVVTAIARGLIPCVKIEY